MLCLIPAIAILLFNLLVVCVLTVKSRDQTLTLSQNYHRLGLTSKLNSCTGGAERLGSQVDEDAKSSAQFKDRLSVASKLPTSISPSKAWIERDPLTGAILRVIHPRNTATNPLQDPLNDVLDPQEDGNNGLVTRLVGIVPQLEEQASMELKKRRRQQSKREEDWISCLIKAYGDDYSRMARDRKLNPYQQSLGDLRRRAMIWKAKRN